MKALIIAVALMATPAQAESINCPAKHHGARLVGAGMYEGKQKEAELMGARKKVPGGVDAEFGFNRSDVKWLACSYEPETVRWYRVSAKVTQCRLQQRNTPIGTVTATLRCQ